MEELIEQFYSNYAWKEDFLEIPTDIGNVHFLIECRYEYDEYLKRVRLKDLLKKKSF